MPQLSTNVENMPRSGIRRIMDRVWSMDEPVLGLHVGEPNFVPPDHALEAAREAYAAGDTHYVPNAGITDLRRALATKLDDSGKPVSSDQVIVSAGGTQALHLAFSMTVAAGDEVLIPDPGWPNFAMAIQLLQAIPVRYGLDHRNDFRPRADELENLITDRTRAIVVNSPSNPLGTVLSDEDARMLAEFAVAHDLWIISDECYKDLTFGTGHVSPAQYDRTGTVLRCFSFSKTYAMTGLRVGYLATPESVAQDAAKLQEPLIACVNAPAQAAALAAICGPQDAVAQMRDSYIHRRNVAMAQLDSCDVAYLTPEGAFYLWMDVRDRCHGDVEAWSMELLRRQHVAVAPGTAFGPAGEGWIRVSLATQTDELLEGLDRITSYEGNADDSPPG